MKWIVPKHDGIDLVDWLYSQRNILDQRKFFTPTIDDMPDPFLIHDMEKGVDFLVKSVKLKKRIFIHGDFDADGVTATSIMWLFLSKYLKADVMPYIPSRFYEGYGLTEESIAAIKEKGGEVIVTVDCGVKDIELVHKYSKEIDFIITDHHTIRSPETESVIGSKEVNGFLISSKAQAVIHPALTAEGFKEVCGAMVAFKLCLAINKKLNLNIDMLEFADLCAIGTVCDVMPLVEDNRIMVQLGLAQIIKLSNIGLKALLEGSRVKDKKINTYHIGFVIGPRLNAAGRLGDALDAVRLLTTSSAQFAGQMAAKLEALNAERKKLTEQYFTLADNELKKSQNDKIFIYFGDDWPEGLLGLIAGKLAEKYSKPVIIGSKGKSYKASARSPEYFNITEFIKNFEKYLEKYGGHVQAAGLTVKPEYLDNFITEAKELAAISLLDDSEPVLYLDGIAKDLAELNIDSLEKLMLLEPFGNKNPKPVIYLNKILLKKHSFMGQKNEHIKLFLTDHTGIVIEALSFGDAQKYENLLKYSTLPIELAVNLEVDEWNGYRKPTLRIVDFKIG